MKVLDLRCSHGHAFEGWFASEDDFLDQDGRGLVECPLCSDRIVQRLPSAPRLNLSGARADTPAASPAASASEPDLQALWLKAVRHVIANTEDVGERFPDEARRIHYGEVESRGIRGRATPEQTQALRDEGIEVTPLPIPAALKESLQ